MYLKGDIVVHDSPDYGIVSRGHNHNVNQQSDDITFSHSSIDVTRERDTTVQHCEITEWTEWSVCSQTCGKHAFQYKRRTVVRKSENGGKQCPSKLERKRKCGVPSCRE